MVDLSSVAGIPEGQTNVHLNFDPMVNDMVLRLKELAAVRKWLLEEDDKMHPGVKDSVIMNIDEEDEFCRAKLQQAWDAVPEFDASFGEPEPEHPNQIVGEEGSNEAFTEEIIVEEPPAPKKRAPRKTAAKKTTRKRAPRKKAAE